MNAIKLIIEKNMNGLLLLRQNKPSLIPFKFLKRSKSNSSHEWASVLLVLVMYQPFAVHAAFSCSSVPTTLNGGATPVAAGSGDLSIGNNSTLSTSTTACTTVNGTTCTNASGSDTTLTQGTGVGPPTQTLPPFQPTTFPAVGTTDVTNAHNTTRAEGAYKKVTTFGTVTFSGGTYYIDELIADKSGSNNPTLIMAAGDYFINKFSATNNFTLQVSSGPVRIFINTSWSVGNDSSINAGGVASNFQLYVYDGGSVQFGNTSNGNTSVDFSGMIYAPGTSTSIQMGNNNVIQGVVLSGGDVQLGNNVGVIFDPATQAAIASINTCGLVAEYRFDACSWTSGTAGAATDSSGNARHGTPYNVTLSTGKIGNSADMTANGTTDYLTFPYQVVHGKSDFTTSLWFKTAASKAQQELIQALGSTVSNDAFEIYLVDSTKVVVNFKDSADLLFTAPSTLTNDAWHHLAVSRSGTSGCLYIDGALVQCKTYASGTLSVNSSSFLAGQEQDAYGGGFNTGQNLQGSLDELKFFLGALTASDISTIYSRESSGLGFDGTTRTNPCVTPPATPAKFNCIESGATASTGRLYTKLAGTAFSFDVAALKTDGTVETNYVTGTSKDVTLELGYATDAACTGWVAVSPAVSQTLSFATADAGRKAAADMTVSKAYPNLRCRVTDANQTPNVVACSADNFAVRPRVLTVTSSDATADATGGSVSATPVIKAGTNFNLTATALAGYNGTPKIDTTKVLAKAGVNGALLGSFTGADITNGISASASTTYSEVGYFNFAINGVYDDTFTNVDQSVDCAVGYSNVKDVAGKYGCNFGNDAASNYFGRFIPDHFNTVVMLVSGVPMSCPTGSCPAVYNGFVYSGQPYSLAVTAKNASDVTTKNYNTTDGYSKVVTLSPWGALGTTTAPSGAGALGVTSVSAFANGTLTEAAEKYTFTTAMTAPTNVYIRADDGEATSLRAVNPTTTSVEGGVAVMDGRLKISSAYGSELLPLPVTVAAQYWNGTSWVTSATDNATSFNTNLSPTGNIVPTIVNGPLALGDISIVGAGNVTLLGGIKTFKLDKPGVRGSVKIDFNTPAYLPSVSGLMTFGVYKGSNNFIYQRENY